MAEILEQLVKSNISIDKTNRRLAALKVLFDIENGDLEVEKNGFNISKYAEANCLFENPDVNVTLGVWKKDKVTWPNHSHANIEEYLIVTRGRFILHLDEAVRIMERGECARIPVGVVHSVISLEDDSQMLGICIPPESAYGPEGECQK